MFGLVWEFCRISYFVLDLLYFFVLFLHISTWSYSSMILLVMHSISSSCTSHLFVPRCFICSKEPGKLTNIQILYFKRISLQILFSGLVQCIFSGRNRRILTLIEFYWKSSFLPSLLWPPLKETQFQCIFTTHSPKARQGKPFFGHIYVDFNAHPPQNER